MTDHRPRRPTPERTRPNRGILGAFGSRDWGQAPTGHPLGFDTQPETNTNTPPLGSSDDDLQAASDLVDRYIVENADDTPDTSFLGGLAQSYGALGATDITALVTQLTKTYADVAAQWVDLASTLKAQLKPATPAVSQTAGPILSLRAACPVEARVEMFRSAQSLTAQPLGSDDPAQTARITKIKVDNNRLNIWVPADQPPGTYYGLLLEENQGPAGVVTVEVLPEDTVE